MKSYFLPIIFLQLVIITYLSFILVDVRWQIRSGFKIQENLNSQNQELFSILESMGGYGKTNKWKCVVNAGGYILIHCRIVSEN